MGFRVQGSGFRVQGPGFRVLGLGFRVYGDLDWHIETPPAETLHFRGLVASY